MTTLPAPNLQNCAQDEEFVEVPAEPSFHFRPPLLHLSIYQVSTKLPINQNYCSCVYSHISERIFCNFADIPTNSADIPTNSAFIFTLNDYKSITAD